METEQDTKPTAASRSYMESKEYKEVLSLFPQLVLGLGDPLKSFKRNMYSDAFEEYTEQFRGMFSNLQLLYYVAEAEGGKEEKDRFLDALAEKLVSSVTEQADQIPQKSVQKKEVYNYNMILVTYSIPLIMNNKTDYCRPLAEKISKKWTEHYPTLQAGVSTYEEINGGFGHKWCYITTAVCQSLGKEDDCMELRILRSYRDGYLAKQEDGMEIIREYYDVAPSIVKHIDRQEDAKNIYQMIFTEYLTPCLEDIHRHEMEQCKIHYMKMVNELRKKYFLSV